MIYNEYVGLYFFSALFQGNMALLALLGVFAVFKRQEITSELQGVDNAIVASVQFYLDWGVVPGQHVAISYGSVADIPNIIKDMSEGKGYPPNVQARAQPLHNDTNFRARFIERNALIERRRTILSKMAPAFGGILSIIIGSLLILPFVHAIHTKTPWLELAMVAVTIISNVWALIVTKRFVWQMLKD